MCSYLLKLFFILFTLHASAHGGEDHGASKPQSQPGKNYFTVSSMSDKFELVLRYEPGKGGEKANMKLFVSDFETNKPVDGAKIQVSTIDGDLSFTVTRLDSGIYNVAGTFPADKDYDLVANISAGDRADLLTLEHISVGEELPKAEEHATKSTGIEMSTVLYIALAFIGGILIAWLLLRRRNSSRTMSIILLTVTLTIPLQPYQQAFAHGGEDHGESKPVTAPAGKTDELEIPKETQFLFDIETTLSKNSSFNNVVTLYGRVSSTPEGEARIMAPQPSSIVTLNVSVGQRVGKGQILAVVQQTLGAGEQVQLEAERSANQGELEQAKKDYDRLKSLEGIVARKEIIAAEIRYKTALENQKVYSSIGGSGRTITIKSPINGVVSNFNLSTGQVLEQGQQLFSVIDNSKLKIDAQVFASDMSKITDSIRFTIDPMDGRRSIGAKMVAFGKMVDPVTQATQLVLETDNPESTLMPGQYVSVNVIAKSEKQQIVVPTSSISSINGKPVIYIHKSPEVFAIRYVQAGESNNESTAVLKGLKEGERVVVNGAYQVKSIYLNQ